LSIFDHYLTTLLVCPLGKLKFLAMKLKSNIATSESGFVFNPATGDSFSSNPVAAEILLLLKDNNSLKEIKQIILSRYEVESSQVEKDLDDFLTHLKENNLLEL